ncbi:MAG: Potassium/proton Antiporter RosB [Myxococcales bacterium]|nr:Potassium/proton Antiporter RosB [Myxococcales bacterium]
MHGAHTFLQNLALVLCVAALTTVIFQRLRQPVVLGYLLAGLIIGPHVPIPLVADAETVDTMAELGVILLLFSVGLELGVRKLLRIGASAGLIALVQVSVMLWLGWLAARALGWTAREALFTGAVLSISSTTIIAKAFDDARIGGKLRELVFAVLVVEDLVGVLLLALLTTVGGGEGFSARAMGVTAGKLALFIAVVLAVGLVTVPRLVRTAARLGRPETTLVVSVGVCFATALLANRFGYSVALGAFLAGALVAESGAVATVEKLVHPVRDLFAAVFFVAVGMTIDPVEIVRNWPAVLALTGLVLVGKLTGVTMGAFFAGHGVRRSLRAGMSMAQIGEFSFILAALGLSLGATRPFLYPVAVAVSALTTLVTPWLIRASDPVASWVDRRLPRPLQTIAALYGSWIERLRSAGGGDAQRRTLRRAIRVLALDAVCLVAITITASLNWSRSPAVVAAAALVLAAPFVLGMVRAAGRIGQLLALRALPSPEGPLDLAASPRRALVVALQLAVLVAAGAPLVALVQPFVRPLPLVALLAATLALMGVALWRRAADLQGHVRAGAQVLAEALASQARGDGAIIEPSLPGIGDPVSHRVRPGSLAVGRSLGELNLRGRSGATVLAIRRDGGDVAFPSAHEVLRAGDLLALAGASEAVASACAFLDGQGGVLEKNGTADAR